MKTSKKIRNNWIFESFSKLDQKNILIYKYSVIDTSPLYNYILSPLWNRIVLTTPKYIHPNILTILGIVMVLLNSTIISYYDWDMKAQSKLNLLNGNVIPNWVWYASAILIFLAHAFDGIDGKQARRIKASSAIGEVLDHGFDSMTAFLIQIIIGTIVSFGSTETGLIEGFCLFSLGLFNFYLSHWEKYITGVLYIPWICDISMIGYYTIMFLMGCTNGKLLNTMNLDIEKAYFILKWTIYISSLLINIPMSFYRIYKYFKNSKMRFVDIKHYIRPGVPFLILFLLEALWLILSRANIYHTHLRIFLFMYGIIFSNMTSRLIVCQLCKRESEIFNILFFFPILMIINCIYNPQPVAEISIMYALFSLSAILHLVYLVSLVLWLKQILQVNVLFVT